MNDKLCEGGNVIAECTDHCDEPDCQACCEHNERDHGICLDCGHESDGSEDIDRAMDSIDMER